MEECGRSSQLLSSLSMLTALRFSCACLAAPCMVATTSTVVRCDSSMPRCSITRMIMLSRLPTSCSSSFFFFRHCEQAVVQAARGARQGAHQGSRTPPPRKCKRAP